MICQPLRNPAGIFLHLNTVAAVGVIEIETEIEGHTVVAGIGMILVEGRGERMAAGGANLIPG